MSEKSYAFIKNIDIVNTAIFDNPSESLLQDFINLHEVDFIIECPAEIMPGYTYEDGDFIPPSPFPSWIKNVELKRWEPPVPYPTDLEEGKQYDWDEATTSWILISPPTDI